ncbi:MAG: hypothetical protein PWR31_292 [Bacillota bacterium]|jgi:hypothetical protein|nr:hypothetical protein [Bacillota bacterium]
MLGVVLGVGLVALTYLSVTERAKGHRRAFSRGEELPVEPRASAMSQALVELVATAGGIYLALVLVRNFLRVDLPERVAFLGFQVEPLATLSLFLALLQPYLTRLLQRSL